MVKDVGPGADCPGLATSDLCVIGHVTKLCAYVLICRIGILMYLLSGVNNLCRIVFSKVFILKGTFPLKEEREYHNLKVIF